MVRGKKLRIAHVCSFYEPAFGGVKQVVKELALRQVADGHDVHVFTSDWDKYHRIKVKNEVLDSIHVHRCVHWFKVANFGSFWPGVFGKILFGKKFDVIHSHVFGHPHPFFSALAGKIKGSRLIHTTHCPWSDAKRSFWAKVFFQPIAYNTFCRWAFKMMDKITAITPWENKFIEKYGGKGKIVNIPNGMDGIFYEKVVPNNFKRENGIPEKDKVVLFFGRLSPTKNPDILASIGKEIVQERKDIWFVFVGPDEGKKEAVAKIIKGVDGMLLLDAIRDRRKIAEMYQAADVYALPSYREGLPLTLFEAMACGCSLLASPVNGIPYEMENNVNGYLIDWKDKKKWKEKILEVLDDSELREKFRKNNLERAKKYDWDLIYKKMMGVYLE